MELADLVLEELRLQPHQWELKPGAPDHLPELYCLVHEDWLARAKDGGPLPLCVSELDPTEVHWLLQPSCEGPPTKPWKRVYVVCATKAPNCAEFGAGARLPVSQGEGFSQHSIFQFLTQVAQENQLCSWKQLISTLQNHTAADGYKFTTSGQLPSNPAVVRHIVKCLYGLSVNQLRAGGSTNHRKDSQNNAKCDGASKPSPEPCHANFLQPEAVLESDRAFYFVYPYVRFTMFDVVTHSPAVMQDSVAKSKLVLYQLLQLLAHCHAQGVTLGSVTLRDLFVDSRLWVQMGLPHGIFRDTTILPHAKVGDETHAGVTTKTPSTGVADSSSASVSRPVAPQPTADPLQDASKYTPPNLCLSEAVLQWKHGRMSNFDYLMYLNYLVGRRMGDPNNHPLMPWVMDFTSRNGGLRDLTKSKYRLEKGDDQLDYTYTSAREEAWRSFERDGSTPHHIGNISTDVTYYVYMARRTCKEVLCSRVRPQWVPGEYPATMERMYKWSPDECIPEFFTDPLLFKSIHPDLPDLVIPSWCSSPEELVRVHRDVLEGDQVSSQLHRWIDLMFGFQLSGDAAYKSKNVYLTLVDNHTSLHCSGVVQLFRSSHPKRVLGSSAPLALLEWQTFLVQSSIAAEASFDTQQVEKLVPRREEKEGKGDGHTSSTVEDTRTLETILSEQSKQASMLTPSGGEGVLEDSFEHVAPDELILEGTTPIDMYMSNRLSTIDYGVSPTDATQGKAVLSSAGGQTRSLNWLRPKKQGGDGSTDHHTPHVEDMAENQKTMVAFPKSTKMNGSLASLEEMMHFAMKSCRQSRELFKKQWEMKDMASLKDANSLHPVIDLLRFQDENPSAVLSFSERVAVDVAAVTCIVVEMCLNKQLRAAVPAFPTLYQRVCTILDMRKSGMLQLPVHLESLVEFVLAPESDRGLPELSPTLLLQQFITIVTFPLYFDTLYRFFSDVEQLCRKHGLHSSNIRSLSRSKTEWESILPSKSSTVITFVQDQITTLLPQLDKEGQGLLLLHLVPFFHFPETCFEATVTFVDQIGQYLSKKHMEQLFLMSMLRAYDMGVEPYQKVQLFSRSVVDTILRRFGLSVFLHRFLGFMLDVAVDPSALTSKHGAHYTSIQPPTSLSEKTPDYHTAVMNEFAFPLNDKLPNDDIDNDDDSDVEVEGEGEIPKMSLLISHAPFVGTSVVGEEDEQQVAGDTQEVRDSTNQPSDTLAVTIGERKNTGPSHSKEQKPSRERKTSSKQMENGSGVLGRTPSIKAPSGAATTPSKPLATGIKGSIAGPVLTSSATQSSRVLEAAKVEKETSGPSVDATFAGDDVEANVSKEEGVATMDPQKQAVINSVVEVVVDTLCWLVRRFGPFLATRYIIKPLRDNLYRSFMGLKGQRAMAVRCLKTFAVLSNTDAVPTKLYLPVAEDMVSAATSKMTCRSEAGLAASLALVKITIETVGKTLKNIAKRLCDNYFIPLIQLISSQVSFPSGASGRAAICHGTVLVLKQLAEGMVNTSGREATMDVMQGTLQSFFNCFGVFQRRESGAPKAKSPTPLGEGVDSVYNQLCHTFNHAMAHAAYIPFCLTLGQINVGKLLSKKDLVEQMAYSYDEVAQKSTLPCVVHKEDYILEEETTAPELSDSEGEKGSDDDEDVQEEAVFNLGPMGSIYAIKKMDKEATGFGRSNWFVDLNEGEGEVEKPGEGAAVGDVAKGNEVAEAGMGTLKRGDRISITSWRSRAKQIADDTISEGLPFYSATSFSSAVFEEKYKDVFAQIETRRSKKGPADDSSGWTGNCWLHTWDSQLTLSPNHEPSFHNFEAKTVQAFVGHQGDIKMLTVPDSEQYFVSNGKDKLSSVKLWTLHSLLSSSSAVLPTQEYKHKGVFAVELLEQVQQLVTCDGSVCIWDIPTAFCLQTYSFQKGNKVAAMATVNSPQPAICTAAGDGVLKFIDLRSKSIAYSWKTTIVGGLCSSMATHDNWVVVGTDSGLVCCSDLRMGEPINSWKLTDTPNTAPWGDSLVRLKATKRGALLASIGSGYISLWKPVSAKPIWNIKGHTSSVLCLETVGEELLSASGNTIVVYPSFELVRDPMACQCNVKTKLKGSISALAALPQNRLILGGTEGGQLVVLS